MSRVVKKVIGFLERILLIFMPFRKGLYVVNYHGTPGSVMRLFEQHLAFYHKHFQVIGPDTFEAICAGQGQKSAKPMLLLTFDDGMKNNIGALELLSKQHILAYFFVVPNYIDAKDQEKYLSEIIRPGFSNKLEKFPEDFLPMTWNDLEKLHKIGHKIGSHTMSHTLRREDDAAKSEVELIESKKVIEQKLRMPVPYFCSINNTALSVGKLQEKMIGSAYDFHFTTYYGLNRPAPDPKKIQRINVESYWSVSEVCYSLGRIRTLLSH